MPFSERRGYVQKSPIQIESMDGHLRTSLYNVARKYMLAGLASKWNDTRDPYVLIFNRAWSNFFKEPLHLSPVRYGGEDNSAEYVLRLFENEEWYQVYDFVEYLVQDSEGDLTDEFNEILDREKAGYRILDSMVVPISDSTQIDAITQGIESTKNDPVGSARMHLSTSLRMLSDRENPDYRNSIKESISAIESASSSLAGKKKPDIKDALRLLEKSGNLHPALRQSFEKLFAWSSDESGIRHAMMEQDTVDFHDAQFMLVASSAFINLLVGKNITDNGA